MRKQLDILWMKFNEVSHGRHLPAAILAITLTLSGATTPLWSQASKTDLQSSNGKIPTYEIVSIKPADPNQIGAGWQTVPNGFDFTNGPLVPLIYQAYGIIFDNQISGLPKWAKTDRYNVSARADKETVEAWENLSKQDRFKQQQLMLQELFTDRCRLKIQREIKELSVYLLVTAKDGLKLKEAASNEKDSISMSRNSYYSSTGSGAEYTMTMTAHAITTQELAKDLPSYAGRIILDKTGLGEKRFDLELKWSSSDQAPNGDVSIFKAVEEQLGLKLEPAKAPVDTFVVEHMEQPSAN